MTGTELSSYLIGPQSIGYLFEDRVHKYIVNKHLAERLGERDETKEEIDVLKKSAIETDIKSLKYLFGISIVIGIIDTIADGYRSTMSLAERYIYWGFIGGVSLIAGIGSYVKVKYVVYQQENLREQGLHNSIMYFWNFIKTLGKIDMSVYGFLGVAAADFAWYPAKQIKDFIFKGEKITYDFPIHNHWYGNAFPQVSLFGVHYGDPTIIGGLPLVHVLAGAMILGYLSIKVLYSNMKVHKPGTIRNNYLPVSSNMSRISRLQ